MTDPQTDTPAADEDVVRAARLDSLGTLLSRILNGLALTPDEGKLLTEHIDTEVRESTTARAVAASNKRHVQTIAPEIDRLTAELEDAEQRATGFLEERDQARAALARVHHLANVIDAGAPWTANHTELATRIRKAATVPPAPAATQATNPDGQLRDLLAAVLATFPDTGPDGPAIRSRPLPAELVHRWKQQANREQPEEGARCCVCHGGPVVYRNYREQPFCGLCANCECAQDPCVRTGVNDPAVSAEARVREPEAALDRVRALADRLEECAENALRTDDRDLYTAIARELHTAIQPADQTTEN